MIVAGAAGTGQSVATVAKPVPLFLKTFQTAPFVAAPIHTWLFAGFAVCTRSGLPSLSMSKVAHCLSMTADWVVKKPSGRPLAGTVHEMAVAAKADPSLRKTFQNGVPAAAPHTC